MRRLRLLALPVPLAVLVAAAGLVGLAAGLPFAMVFTGSALARPDAPGAAIGFVNAFASLTIVAGTPLVGLTFSLPGDGRIGFVVIAVLAVLAALGHPRVAAHSHRPDSRFAGDMLDRFLPTEEARCSASASPSCPTRRSRASSS